jgi:hypothetical protein
MERVLKQWKWPARKDVMKYEISDFIAKIQPPKPVKKRGYFLVTEINN